MVNKLEGRQLERVALPYFDSGFEILSAEEVKSAGRFGTYVSGYKVSMIERESKSNVSTVLTRKDTLLGQILAIIYRGTSPYITFSRNSVGDVICSPQIAWENGLFQKRKPSRIWNLGISQGQEVENINTRNSKPTNHSFLATTYTLWGKNGIPIHDCSRTRSCSTKQARRCGNCLENSPVESAEMTSMKAQIKRNKESMSARAGVMVRKIDPS